MNPHDRILEVAVGLLAGSDPDTSLLGPREVDLAIRFCQRNKISLLELVQKDGEKQFQRGGLFGDALNKAASAERRRYRDWRESFIRIKQEWDPLGIDYVFFKSSGRFPHLSDNLDVLVRTSEFARAADSLVHLGYTDIRRVQEAHKRFYRRLESDERWAPIHLHERVCWGFPYDDIEHLWDHALSSSEDGIVRYPCPEDGILVHTAHSFLEDHQINLADLLTMRKCLHGRALDWDYVIRTARNMNWSHALWTGFVMAERLYLRFFGEPLFPQEIIKEAKSYVSRKRWIGTILERRFSSGSSPMPFKVSHLWTRVHSSLRVLQDHTLGNWWQRSWLVFSHVLDGFIHLKLKINTHPRMFIAFCGLDGSGKTRHSQALEKAFRRVGVNARIVWSRAGSLPLTRFLLRILRAVKFDYQKRAAAGRGKGRAGHLSQQKWSTVLWSMVNEIDMGFVILFRIALPLAFGRVVIADRFLYDFEVDLEILREAPNLQRSCYRFLQRLAPTPDMLFFMDIEPSQILERGVDEDRDCLEKKRRLYQEVVNKARIARIDTDRPFDTVESEVIRKSMEAFFRKYPDKYDGYQVVSFRF